MSWTAGSRRDHGSGTGLKSRGLFLPVLPTLGGGHEGFDGVGVVVELGPQTCAAGRGRSQGKVFRAGASRLRYGPARR